MTDAQLEAAMTLADRGFFRPAIDCEWSPLLSSIDQKRWEFQRRSPDAPNCIFIGRKEKLIIAREIERHAVFPVPEAERTDRRMVMGMKVFVVDADTHLSVGRSE